MPGRRENNRTLLVSFSGIDGAGKSTQIEALSARLAEDGLRIRLIRFWDDEESKSEYKKKYINV